MNKQAAIDFARDQERALRRVAIVRQHGIYTVISESEVEAYCCERGYSLIWRRLPFMPDDFGRATEHLYNDYKILGNFFGQVLVKFFGPVAVICLLLLSTPAFAAVSFEGWVKIAKWVLPIGAASAVLAFLGCWLNERSKSVLSG